MMKRTIPMNELLTGSSRTLKVAKRFNLRMLMIVLFATAISSADAQEDCELQTSMFSYMNSNSTGGTFGYYLKEVNGDVLATRNETYAFYPASTIKVMLHANAVRNFNLNTNTFAYGFPESCDNNHSGANPVTRSLQNALPIMMINSGNGTTNAVVELIGGGNASNGRTLVNSMMSNVFGLSNNMKLNHKLGCNGPNNNPANKGTLRDFSRFYEQIMSGTYLTNAQRTSFSGLMINENTTTPGFQLGERINSEVDNLIDDNNLDNLSASEIQDFKDEILMVHKAGSIDNAVGGDDEYLSDAGWISIPFKRNSINNSVTNKAYVYSFFYDQVTNETTSSGVTAIELIREELLAALQTWNAKAAYIQLKDTYTSEQVGELLSPELGTTKDAIAVVALSSTQAVTPIRDASGRLKLISWSITNNGTNITRQKSYTTGSQITAVKAVKLSNGRMVTAARLTNGNLQLIYWRVNNQGTFTRKDTEYAGFINDLDLVRMDQQKVVTPVSTSGRDLKVIVWKIGATEQISRKGSATVNDADVVSGAAMSSSRLATATKNRNTGNLEVQYWSVSSSGNTVTLRSSGSAGGIDDVSMVGLSYGQFATNVIQGNGLQKSIVWEVCFDGSIQRKSDGSYTNIRDIASEQAVYNKRQVVVARDNSNRLRMSVWDTGSEGQTIRVGARTSEIIGQAEVAVLTPYSSGQCILTAYTTSTDQLRLRTWGIGDVVEASLAEAAGGGDESSDEIFGSILNETVLQQNYPNPFSDETTISFSLDEKEYVELKVLDFKGAEVLTLVNG